jgi:hypothetical protein
MVELWYRDTPAADRHRLAEIDALIAHHERADGTCHWKHPTRSTSIYWIRPRRVTPY